MTVSLQAVDCVLKPAEKLNRTFLSEWIECETQL